MDLVIFWMFFTAFSLLLTARKKWIVVRNPSKVKNKFSPDSKKEKIPNEHKQLPKPNKNRSNLSLNQWFCCCCFFFSGWTSSILARVVHLSNHKCHMKQTYCPSGWPFHAPGCWNVKPNVSADEHSPLVALKWRASGSFFGDKWGDWKESNEKIESRIEMFFRSRSKNLQINREAPPQPRYLLTFVKRLHNENLKRKAWRQIWTDFDKRSRSRTTFGLWHSTSFGKIGSFWAKTEGALAWKAAPLPVRWNFAIFPPFFGPSMSRTAWWWLNLSKLSGQQLDMIMEWMKPKWHFNDGRHVGHDGFLEGKFPRHFLDWRA